MINIRLLKIVSEEHDRLREEFRKELDAIGSRIPVGGAHMDLFFRFEALGGVLVKLREGKPIDEAIAEGKARSAEAVKKWNSRREYQVHRWERCCDDYIEFTIKRMEERSND